MRNVFTSFLLPSVVALATVGCSTHRAERPKAHVEANDAGTSKGQADPYVDENSINEGDTQANPVVTPPVTETRTDLEITQEVRQALAADYSLSARAKQVKIVTANGVVTLGGAVGSEKERRTVVGTAQRIAGVTRVNDRTVVVR